MSFIGPNFGQPQRPFVPQPQAMPGMGAMPMGPTGGGPMIAFGGVAVPLENVMLAQFVLQNLQISPQDSALLLKNLMRLPQDVKTMLALMTTPEGLEKLKQQAQTKPQQELNQALTELLNAHGGEEGGQSLNLDGLQKLLQSKTGEGTQKILQLLIQQNQQAFGGRNNALGELMTMMRNVSSQIQQSPLEALNQMVLLYLPWYPLQPPHKLNVSFENNPLDGEGEGDGGQENPLILMIETAHLGRFRAGIVEDPTAPKKLMVRVDYDREAEPYHTGLGQKLTGALKEDGMPPPEIQWTLRKPRPERVEATPISNIEALDQALNEDPQAAQGPIQLEALNEAPSQERKLAIYPTQGVSIYVVNAAYLFARTIFNLDVELSGGRLYKSP